MAAPISPTAFITNSCNLASFIGSGMVGHIEILQGQKPAISEVELI
jgi:hypothetical protein